MERVKKKLLTAFSVIAGLTMVMAMGFWTLSADAITRPNLSLPMTRAAVAEPARPVAAASPVTQAAQSAPNLNSRPIPALPAVEEHAGILNPDRQFALGMIETANDDREIGSLGEVSRYQIMPSVWRHYTRSRQYQNPDVSLRVARQHWLSLYNSFKRQTRREPTDFDMYVLWNTSYGYYANRSWKPTRLGSVVRDRAQRFANLVERGNT